MYRLLILIALFFITPHFIATQAKESDILNSSSFKITIISEGKELEWEYENPDDYEFEKGNTVIKGEKAKKEVLKMFTSLNLKEDSKVEDLKKVLQENGFDKMDKFEVRLKNFDQQLLTWKWEK